MKKSVSLLLAIVTIITLCLPVFAEQGNGYEYRIDNVTVLFSEVTPFSPAERELIAVELAGGIPANGFDIRCLFGHNYETDIVTAITHKARIYDPRCLSETYEVKICSRCGNATTELLYSHYISCCPED